MYQVIYYDRYNSVGHIWDDVEGHYTVPYQKYGYQLDPDGDMMTLDGRTVSRVDMDPEEPKTGFFEGDVPHETRILVDLYGDSDEIPTHHRKLAYDIEVEKGERGYVENIEEDPFNRINGITVYDYQTKLYTVFILDETGKLGDERTIDNRVLVPCGSEKTLISRFYDLWHEINPTIITGWNIDTFDNPYLFYRTKLLFGPKFAKRLSPLGIVKRTKENEFGQSGVRIAGVYSLDAMKLYKKFTFGEMPSYTLDYIANKELGRGKIEYEGNLQILFDRDPEKFIDYNVTDVELVVDIDDNKDLINQAIGICHKGHIGYEDVYYSSKYLEGASLTFMRKMNMVAPNKPYRHVFEISNDVPIHSTRIMMSDTIPPETPGSGQLKIAKSKSSSFEIDYTHFKNQTFYLEKPTVIPIQSIYGLKIGLPGAFVKEPIKGRYKWIFDLDLTSLYPSIIMSLNISPETKVGKIIDWDSFDWIKQKDRTYKVKIKTKTTEYTHAQLREYIESNGYLVAANGVYYMDPKVKKGFIPKILEQWFEERVKFKDLMKKHGNLGDTEKQRFYFMKQLVAKVLLNSFYGVLGLASFRFSDNDNAAAVTSTGVQVIKYSATFATKYYNMKLGTNMVEDEVCMYTDTDSTFLKAEPMLTEFYPDVDLEYSINTMEIPDEDVWIKGLTKYLDGRELPQKAYKIWLKKKYAYDTVQNELKITDAILEIAGGVQGAINESYDLYAKAFHNAENHRFDIKQELISKSGFWSKKKRYCQWVINNEGIPSDYMDVKGLDVVRSSFPKAFQDFMKIILKDILEGITKDEMIDKILNFRKTFPDIPLLDIMFVSSIKNFTKYQTDDFVFGELESGATAVAKAVINYNDLLTDWKIQEKPIQNGDKVKWTYMQSHNPYRMDSLAIKGYEDPDKVINYIKEYIDYNTIYVKQLKTKLDDFFIALKWGSVPDSKSNTKFFTFH